MNATSIWEEDTNEDKGEEKRVYDFCLQCGLDKKEIKKDNSPCTMYGIFPVHFPRHTYKI